MAGDGRSIAEPDRSGVETVILEIKAEGGYRAPDQSM